MVCDEQLVKQAISGNEEAFRQLVERYKAYIFAIVLNFIKDHFEAENVAQEVFLQIYRSLPSYRFQSFKSWIARIAVNKALDWQRTEKKRNMQHQPVLDDWPDQRCATPEELIEKKEEIRCLREICSALPSVYRCTVEKFYMEGKSQQQIAQEEGTTIKTIESRLYRARNLLKEKWKEAEL